MPEMIFDTAKIDAVLDQVSWNDQGLVPAIAQDAASRDILMMAWMNREALATSFNKEIKDPT